MKALAQKSLSFAQRELDICRFTMDACFIGFLEATDHHELRVCGEAMRQSIARYEAALHKRDRELRVLSESLNK